MSRSRVVSLACLLSFILVGGAAVPAEAASAVTIKRIAGKTIKKNAKTTIRPNVAHSSNVKVLGKTITVKKGKKTIARKKASARVKPGTYKVTTRVDYKTFKTVTKRRTISEFAYGAGETVDGSCSIARVPTTSLPYSDLGLTCVGRSEPLSAFNATALALDGGDGTWMVLFNDGSSTMLPASTTQALVGQRVHGQVTAANSVYRVVTQQYRAREYSKKLHRSKTQTLKIKAKKVKKKHACTRTASGTCIQGGQFCPQKKYGQSGWDANGRRYVCKGDRTHPHWYKP